MDAYGDDIRQHEYHPSHSIPDAAYPDDSPYRPGTGGAGVAAAQQLQSHSQYHVGAGGYLPSTNPSTIGFGSLGTTGTAPSSNTSVHHHHHQGAWPPYDIPSSPPPPYDPSQPPIAYSPLDLSAAPPSLHPPPPTSSISTVRTNDNHYQNGGIPGRHTPEVVPLQLMPSASSRLSTISRLPQLVGPAASTSALTQGSSSPEDAAKFDAAVEARRRRKHRRLKLCVVFMAVVLLFIVALAVGVAVGIFKARHHDNGGNDDHHDPFGGP